MHAADAEPEVPSETELIQPSASCRTSTVTDPLPGRYQVGQPRPIGRSLIPAGAHRSSHAMGENRPQVQLAG